MAARPNRLGAEPAAPAFNIDLKQVALTGAAIVTVSVITRIALASLRFLAETTFYSGALFLTGRGVLWALDETPTSKTAKLSLATAFIALTSAVSGWPVGCAIGAAVVLNVQENMDQIRPALSRAFSRARETIVSLVAG